MTVTRSLGRRFGWLWAAYTVSTFGTSFAFNAFPLIAILVLHAGPAAVAALAAAGPAAGAAAAAPFGPWMESHRKRPVMVAMDLVRFAAVLSVPAAFVCGLLSFGQLLAVSVITAAAGLAFKAASGAYLKAVVGPEDLLAANARLESTTWTAIVVGPPLGGTAFSLFGPVATVVADAVSYLLSALGIGAIGGAEPPPAQAGASRSRAGDLLEGWRHILAQPALRALFFNTIGVNGLILAPEPVLAVLMLGRLHFAPWQYGLAFAAPSAGGLLGSRLAPRLVARFGQHKVIRAAGTARACWPVALAFVRPGAAGLWLVMIAEFGLITCIGVFNPVLATCRLSQTPPDRLARTLSAWSIAAKVAIAVMTALWGLLAELTSPRAAIALAGLLLLATPLLLPRRGQAPQRGPELAESQT